MRQGSRAGAWARAQGCGDPARLLSLPPGPLEKADSQSEGLGSPPGQGASSWACWLWAAHGGSRALSRSLPSLPTPTLAADSGW